jgi:drug/metabolite transporter (DMT)-like permease
MEAYDPSYVTASMILAGTVFLVVWTAIFERPRFNFSSRAWLAVAAQGVLATAVAYLLWNWGMARLPAAKAGIFFNMEPLVGTLLGVLVLNERLGRMTIFGAAMIICGALYFSMRTNASEKQ